MIQHTKELAIQVVFLNFFSIVKIFIFLIAVAGIAVCLLQAEPSAELLW
jgi:hypothetical protein